MKMLFAKYTHTSVARLAISAALLISFFETYVSKTPGQILAIIIDMYDRDGKSDYIRF